MKTITICGGQVILEEERCEDCRDYVLASEANERIKVLEDERDRLKEDVKRLKLKNRDLRYSLEYIEGDERYANLRARHAALVKAANKLVDECEAEFTLDGYWNNDGALVTRKTVSGLKAELAKVKG
jgi:hypothetical protein